MKATRLLTRSSASLMVLLMMLAAAPAVAQEATTEQRVEVHELISERDRLHRRLQELDRRAAEAIKRGQSATALHAEQVSVQDQLDLVQLRLEVLATRYGLSIPALPGEREVRGENEPAEAESTERSIERNFERGRRRAMQHVRSDYARFLASVDYSAFLGVDRFLASLDFSDFLADLDG